MSGFAKVIIGSARLTADPEIKHGQRQDGSLSVIANFRVAVDRKSKEKVTDYIHVKCFGKNAEFAEQWLKRATAVNIIGDLNYETWKKQDGSTGSELLVVASQVEFSVGNPKPDQNQQAPQNQNYAQNGYGSPQNQGGYGQQTPAPQNQGYGQGNYGQSVPQNQGGYGYQNQNYGQGNYGQSAPQNQGYNQNSYGQQAPAPQDAAPQKQNDYGATQNQNGYGQSDGWMMPNEAEVNEVFGSDFE